MNELSERAIGCAPRVLNTRGPGFLEKVQENAMAPELRKAGLAVEQQQGITVLYDGIVVGEYAVDLLVEEGIIVKPKAIEALGDAHAAQCINYLKTTGRQLCLLLDFGKSRPEIRRFVLGLCSGTHHLRPSARICGKNPCFLGPERQVTVRAHCPQRRRPAASS